jgi:hypothetical protein
MDLRSQTSERKNKDAPNSCLGAVLISIPGAHRYTKWVKTQGIQTSQTALFGYQKRLEEECCGKGGMDTYKQLRINGSADQI